MNDTENQKFVGTLAQQRVVNALLSAAALQIGNPAQALTVADAGEEPYARVDAIIEDVVLALSVPEDIVRLALESALQQGLLVTPPAFPRSEFMPLVVRPATL